MIETARLANRASELRCASVRGGFFSFTDMIHREPSDIDSLQQVERAVRPGFGKDSLRIEYGLTRYLILCRLAAHLHSSASGQILSEDYQRTSHHRKSHLHSGRTGRHVMLIDEPSTAAAKSQEATYTWLKQHSMRTTCLTPGITRALPSIGSKRG